MPLPIVPFLTGMFGRMIAGMGTGIKGAVVGAVGRAALGGGATGAAGRLGLAGMAAASGRQIPAPVVGGLAKDFATLGISIATLPAKIRDWGNAIIESQRHLAQYNGELAAALSQLDADRINRDMRQAQVLAPSASRLARNQSKLEESLLPIQTTFTDNLNKVMASFAGAAASVMDGPRGFNKSILSELLGIKKTIEELKQKTPDPPLNQLSLDIASGKFHQRQHPPKPPLS